jgi:hypothetical protein
MTVFMLSYSTCRGTPPNTAKGVFVAGDEGGDLHVADEFDVAGAAVAERGAEGVERPAAFAEFDPVDLHLGAGFGFEADDRFVRERRFQCVHEGAQLAAAAGIALRDDFAIQHAGRNPVRMRRHLPFAQVGFKRRTACWGASLCARSAAFPVPMRCARTVLTAQPTSAAICRRLSPCFLKTLISTYTSSLIIKAPKKP